MHSVIIVAAFIKTIDYDFDNDLLLVTYKIQPNSNTLSMGVSEHLIN